MTAVSVSVTLVGRAIVVTVRSPTIPALLRTRRKCALAKVNAIAVGARVQQISMVLSVRARQKE